MVVVAVPVPDRDITVVEVEVVAGVERAMLELFDLETVELASDRNGRNYTSRIRDG